MIAISFSANRNVNDCFASERITEMPFPRIFGIFNIFANIFTYAVILYFHIYIDYVISKCVIK